jgi:hypothetical protein
MNASVRIVRVLVVPYPLSLDAPAVPVSFAAGQMKLLRCHLPVTLDIRLSRDRIAGLLSAVGDRPMILLVSRRRWWRTNEERLAATLKRAGKDVLLTYDELAPGELKRPKQETTTCSIYSGSS